MNYQQIEILKNMPTNERSLYNGKTIEQIENNMFAEMPEFAKVQYVNNCKRVIECQMYQMNLHEVEYLSNTNYLLVKTFSPIFN